MQKLSTPLYHETTSHSLMEVSKKILNISIQYCFQLILCKKPVSVPSYSLGVSMDLERKETWSASSGCCCCSSLWEDHSLHPPLPVLVVWRGKPHMEMGRSLSHTPGPGMEVLCGSGDSFSHGSARLEVDAAALLTEGWQPASGAAAKTHQLLSQPMSGSEHGRICLKMEASFLSWALLLLWDGCLLKASLRGGRDSHLRAPTASTD